MIFRDNPGKTFIAISVILLSGVWWFLQLNPKPVADDLNNTALLSQPDIRIRKRPLPSATTSPSTRPAQLSGSKIPKSTKNLTRPTVTPAVTPGIDNPTDPAATQMDVLDPFEPEIYAPEAREALVTVGVDPQANAVWLEAINDLTIPPDERRNLIEDLNEDGFKDPKHITEDEIPLILSRLELIELLAADAADEVNLKAFEEAYQDLINMLPEPVQVPEPVSEPVQDPEPK